MFAKIMTRKRGMSIREKKLSKSNNYKYIAIVTIYSVSKKYYKDIIKY